MNSRTIIRTLSGAEHHTPAYPHDVHVEITRALDHERMAEFETTSVPSQIYYIDPHQIESVRPDPYA